MTSACRAVHVVLVGRSFDYGPSGVGLFMDCCGARLASLTGDAAEAGAIIALPLDANEMQRSADKKGEEIISTE